LNIRDRAVWILLPQLALGIWLTRSLLDNVSNNAAALRLDFEHVRLRSHFLLLFVITSE
jgi:hypothetical protein